MSRPAHQMLDESVRISEHNFNRLAAFVQAQTGIKMPPSKRSLVEGRLTRCLRQSGATSVDEYCELVLDGQAGDEELLRLINAITTNKTDFFREPGHFDAMRNLILPSLVRDGINRAHCWSAASSTGMEAYSMAMVLDDFAQSHRTFDFDVLATDIDTNVLAEAQRGVYPLAALAPIPSELRARYVQRALDPARAEGRIVPALRRKLSFARMNLMDASYAVGREMDLIFCRNVLIYFEKEVQAQVIRRLCDVLSPEGFLVLGHSESIMGLDLPLKTVATTVFRKK